MKTLAELYEQLKTLGVPIAYRMFPKGEAPELPYLIYYREGTTGVIAADNTNYYMVPYVILELYYIEHDEQLENAIESILNEMETPFEKYEVFIESEGMSQTGYEISLY